MGFAGISPWSLLLIIAIIVLLFGTKRLRNIGHDVGAAMKSFREGINDANDDVNVRVKKSDEKQET